VHGRINLATGQMDRTAYMGLREYRRKRHLGATLESFGGKELVRRAKGLVGLLPYIQRRV
jgi:hypothetical protein